MKKALVLIFLSLLFLGCNSDELDSLDELFDLAIDPPSRRSIDKSRMGVNNFFVNAEFGSIQNQFLDIRDNLGIKFVRVLFAWTDSVQGSPSASANYSFFDNIVSNIPSGMDVVVVLAHTPGWMANSANWIDGDPRKTWVERWLRPTVARYAGNPRIVGWEVWNEPDLLVVQSDAALGLEDVNNYFSLLSMGSSVIRSIDPNSRVLNAATASIQQEFPDKLNFNSALKDLGAESLIDIWNIHYYGEQYERVVRDGGIADFLNGVSKPIWLTESGETGPNEQLSYVETTWPFLREKISGIDRIYYYEYSSPAPIDNNFALRTTDPSFPVSDLFLSLTSQ